MSTRTLRQAMDKAHDDGLRDGLLHAPHDPAIRTTEPGWSPYLRWAYNAGHEQGRVAQRRVVTHPA